MVDYRRSAEGVGLSTKIRIIAFPDDDRSFALRVRTALDAFDGDGTSMHETISHVLEQFLPEYPKLQIRQQDGLAAFGRDPLTWYVYRDGHAVPTPRED